MFRARAARQTVDAPRNLAIRIPRHSGTRAVQWDILRGVAVRPGGTTDRPPDPTDGVTNCGPLSTSVTIPSAPSTTMEYCSVPPLPPTRRYQKQPRR